MYQTLSTSHYSNDLKCIFDATRGILLDAFAGFSKGSWSQHIFLAPIGLD